MTRLRLLAAAVLMTAAGLAASAELGVLAPALHDNAPATRPVPDGKGSAPVLTRVRDGKLFSALQREAAHGFTASMLELDELAMQVAGAGKQTTWLQLAQEDGGFARRGFWLQDGSAMRWVDEPMVDLVVNEASIADGSFEEIFAHELGHVILRRLVPNLPNGYSRTEHHSFSVTDQPTAFDEGWATHFQGIASLLTGNERLRAFDAGLEGKPFLPLWLSNLDRESRIIGMRQNWFVHRQVTPDGADDAIVRHDLSTLFDRARLKNAPQMLATEGVLATVFYRQLAPSSRAGLAARYAPMFRSLRALSADKLDADTALLPALAQAMQRTDPAEGQRFVTTLTQTTYGALSSPEIKAATEALAAPGRLGDGDAFVPALQAIRKQFDAELAQVQAHPDKLAAHAGPALWLAHPGHKVAGQPLVVDLNTAEREHLLALPGIDANACERALASRARDGNFTSIADFAARAGLDAPQARAFEAMAQELKRMGPNRRE
ncbi:ComEA family DNA-binding protein [Massilia horti]|uniref:Peptidase M48 domain-containing protein n=1 Tax=Massilia horti TaxID=2562153 RepID=A0A4Y9T3N6_9BURK|nr:helix-hairpin-helix domain-containing protein [Massilia horti]TFW34395.1 hypothetical protein E4O92_04125 [Massilia horti]